MVKWILKQEIGLMVFYLIFLKLQIKIFLIKYLVKVKKKFVGYYLMVMLMLFGLKI